MSKLMERARADAKARDRERRERQRQDRKRREEELDGLLGEGREFVERKIGARPGSMSRWRQGEMEGEADPPIHRWDFTVDGVRFELEYRLSARRTRQSWRLYRVVSEGVDGERERRFIRRAADLLD